jgi:hypothetical protein
MRLGISVDEQASSNASLGGCRTGTHTHVQVHVGTCARAGEDGLLKTQLQHGLVDKVGLGRAVGSRSAVDGAASRVGAAHGQTTVGARAVGGALARSTVHKGDVVPQLVVDDAVFKLRVLAADELVGLADLEGGRAAAAHGLGVLGTCGNVDGR